MTVSNLHFTRFCTTGWKGKTEKLNLQNIAADHQSVGHCDVILKTKQRTNKEKTRKILRNFFRENYENKNCNFTEKFNLTVENDE